jgi:hypothetical protein
MIQYSTTLPCARQQIHRGAPIFSFCRLAQYAATQRYLGEYRSAALALPGMPNVPQTATALTVTHARTIHVSTMSAAIPTTANADATKTRIAMMGFSAMGWNHVSTDSAARAETPARLTRYATRMLSDAKLD